jgi:hypothetical protein
MSDAGADHREPVIVATFLDAGEAEVAQAKLRAFGIEAFVIDQAEMIPTLEASGGVGVEVRAADADDAVAILNEDGGEAEPEPA